MTANRLNPNIAFSGLSVLDTERKCFVNTVNQIAIQAVQQGIVHLHTKNERFAVNTIALERKRVSNFGSCGYLGMEFYPRLKRAAQDAVERCGIRFSDSRAYVSLSLYGELEGLPEKIFDAYCGITPTTNLGCIAAIQVLVSDEDAVITDQQVHHSVQMVVPLLKPAAYMWR